MSRVRYLLEFSILISQFLNTLCLQVVIKENHDIPVEPFKSRINKRDVTQFFDQASYSLNGFEKIESVPIIYPLDICFFKVQQTRHVACLHINEAGARHFAILKAENGKYTELLRLNTPLAIGMDCRSFDNKGFVALAYNITIPVEQANLGSPIFKIDSERTKTIQYFGAPNLRAVHLRSTANDLYLLQTFTNSPNESADLSCPYLKWSGYGFTKLGQIPCSNARRLEPFMIDSGIYVAVANYADKYGHTQTTSEIYKYDRERAKLISFQKIKTNGAVDVKYFSVPLDEVRRQHYLIFGNSAQADSVIYIFEKNRFVPYQKLSLYGVEQFLPVENDEQEKFILLVACSNQDIKIYNIKDWKFEESTTQFTDGALGKGVSKMRIFKDDDRSYLVIANERMLENRTNVFLPIFKQEEHANSLRQRIIDWTTETTERLKGIDVEKLKTDMRNAIEARKKQEVPKIIEIPFARIGTVHTRSLISPSRNLTTNYWKALSYVQQAIETLEARANMKYSMKRDVSNEEYSQYTHKSLSVGTLVVRSNLTAKKINGVDLSDIKLDTITAPKIVVNGDFKKPLPQGRSDITPEFLDSLHVDQLKVTGKLNGILWRDLQANTLKRTGQQILKTPVNISTLRTDTFLSTSDMISDHNLSKLVLIDGGNYVINQDIRFTKPIFVNNLLVKERLNHINVFDNKLDVLLVNSDEVQQITGKTSFENIKLLEPVTISGKILGELNVMSPFKPIHDAINLTGDYTITGDVNVKGILSANDLIGLSGVHSMKEVLSKGIPVSDRLNDLNLKFLKPIEANNTITPAVNDQDVGLLIRADSEDVQVIEGQKNFKGSLRITRGFVEAKFLNGVDFDRLEKRILLKDGPQNFTGNVRIHKVKAKRVESPAITLRGQPLADYLTKSGDQTSEGSLKVKNLKAQRAAIENLQTQRTVFGRDLQAIQNIDTPDPAAFHNFAGTIHAENLNVEGLVNGNSVEDIERWFIQLKGNVKYVGALRLRHDVRVPQVTFTGRFNGIPADQFSECWLQQGKDQIFTAPQIFASVYAPNGLQLSGRLNGHEFSEFMSGTYKLDRDEHIPEAIFEGSTDMDELLSVGTVNGLRIPGDILLTNPLESQVLIEPVICRRTIHVKGNIRQVATINNISLSLLKGYLDGKLDTFTVQHAFFENAPNFTTLNSHNLRETMDSVWFANANVDLKHHVEVTYGYFKEPLEFHGPINEMNLKFVKDNYFSLSRPQQVSAEIQFTRGVTFVNDVDVENLHLFGPIVDKTSDFEFNFDDFVQNSLHTQGEQIVTGQWNIYEASVTGDLIDVRINGLNLAEDVALYDSELVQIDAPKHVRSAEIESLHSQPGSTVSDVDLAAWMRDTVLIYGNYTICGVTSIDSATFSGDIQVRGKVNNITFDDHSLLLRDREQVIHGDVQIIPVGKGMTTSSFDELHVDNLNGLNIDEFFKHLCRKTPCDHISGSVKFTSPVIVEKFTSGAEIIDSEGNKRDLAAMHDKTAEKLNDLNTAVRRITHAYQGDKFYLSHFDQKQILQIAAKQIISLTLRIGKQFVDIIGILTHNDGDQMQFYRWDFYLQEFVTDTRLSFLPRRKVLIDIFRAAFGKAEYLAMEKSIGPEFYENLVSTDTEGLEEIFRSNASRFIEALEVDGDDCFVTFRDNDGVANMYCVEIFGRKLRFVHRNTLSREGVLQIVSLERDIIAMLVDDSVEIWRPSTPENAVQRISAVNPSQIAVVVTRESTKYLAICSKVKPKSFHHGSVDIYRSIGETPFEQIQTIDIVSPMQVQFALLPESHDILLHILTDSFDEPLAIYHYRGVSGFQPIVTSSTLPPASAINTIHLKANRQHLVAVLAKDDITFIECVLAKT